MIRQKVYLNASFLKYGFIEDVLIEYCDLGKIVECSSLM